MASRGKKLLEIALVEPEIPPNTGNIIRLAANTGAALHLIEPLGFSLDDRRLRRAGLDYHEFSRVTTWSSWDQFRRHHTGRRLLGFTTRASVSYASMDYRPDDILVFGSETRGLSEAIRSSLPDGQRLRIPMQDTSRSLNLSNAVAIALYEALRQQDFFGQK